MRYVSTTNPAEVELRSAIEGTVIQSPVDLEFEYISAQELLAESGPSLDRIHSESFVVIDPIDRLEQGEYNQHLSFINLLKKRLRETESVRVLYCLDSGPVPDSRRLTLQCADYVWRIEQVPSPERSILDSDYESRGGRALSEPTPPYSYHVRVDTSRRIA